MVVGYLAAKRVRKTTGTVEAVSVEAVADEVVLVVVGVVFAVGGDLAVSEVEAAFDHRSKFVQ